MSFFDSGLVHFIKLLIIIGLISMLYMIVMQKIKEQNHKISSLLSLVTTMAHEITTLKQSDEIQEFQETHESQMEKDEISDDSDSDDSDDSDSESDSESIDLEEIDLTKGDKITMMESESDVLESAESVLESVESVLESVESDVLESISSDVLEILDPVEKNEVNIKKMNTTQLVDLVVSKGLKTKTDAKKLKKGELIQLL